MKLPSSRSLRNLALVAVAGGLAALVGATAVRAAVPGDERTAQATPGKWNWEIRDGKRVPKAQRQTNPDGSWRETVKVGNCTTVKEQSPAGEYRESRSCD